MRIGFFGWVFLVGCTTTAVSTAPSAPASSAGTPPPASSPATCTDSSQCAAGALCCPSIKSTAGLGEGVVTPFGPPHSTLNVCATDPVHECEGHEICGAQPCRSPWPTRLPPTPVRTYIIECRASRDCPKDATCAFFYFQNSLGSSICVYNVASEPHLDHVTPACATDADCKSALVLWKSALGDPQYSQAVAGARCVELKNDAERRRVCSVPGNAPLP